MRNYPRNSSQAAARLVALAALADGTLCKSEIEALERAGAPERLGLETGQWQSVLHGFCEDLLTSAQSSWSGSCTIDPDTIASLFAEVEDPQLRILVLELSAAVIDADQHLSDGESIVLDAAATHWKLLPARAAATG